jgi:hypothetical protein
LQALSPSQVIAQRVASRHSTFRVHASLPRHETLHGMPDGQRMLASHFAPLVQVNEHASFAHVPPAAAQRACSQGGVGVEDVAVVDASGSPTSSTVGWSMHP